jgi:hypothetical protein
LLKQPYKQKAAREGLWGLVSNLLTGSASIFASSGPWSAAGWSSARGGESKK